MRENKRRDKFECGFLILVQRGELSKKLGEFFFLVIFLNLIFKKLENFEIWEAK